MAQSSQSVEPPQKPGRFRPQRSATGTAALQTGFEPSQALLCNSGYVGKPFAQGVQDILSAHVIVQIAKRSELHTFKVMPQR